MGSNSYRVQPKLWAMRYIEVNEKSPRAWYGGAVGAVGFNGDMNTGLTLRHRAYQGWNR